MTAARLADFCKAYDVRGIVPDQLNEEVAAAIGAAFARVIAIPDSAGAVVVGHDMRPSSPTLATAFGEGVASAGLDVIQIGLCSTDGLYYASGALDLPGAMFTASHNPAQYNGIKLCRSGARPVSRETGLSELTGLAQSWLDDPAGRPTAERTGQVTARDLLGDYAAFLRGLVDLSGSRPLKVVVDAGNGMGGHTVPAVLGTGAGLPTLPIDVVPLYFELDGTFPNHEANPLEPENLRDLQHAVVEHGADIGLAFDGDADRCFVIDERGAPVTPSAVTAMVATREIAKAGAGARVVYNLISSRGVPRSSPNTAVIRSAPGSATRSSRPKWPRTRRFSGASTRLTTTSGISGLPTLACWPRCTCSRHSVSRTARCRSWLRHTAGMSPRARSTPG